MDQSPRFDLDGQTAFGSGASRGHGRGRATDLDLADARANVALSVRGRSGYGGRAAG